MLLRLLQIVARSGISIIGAACLMHCRLGRHICLDSWCTGAALKLLLKDLLWLLRNGATMINTSLLIILYQIIVSWSGTGSSLLWRHLLH